MRFRPDSRNDDNRAGALQQDARDISKSGQSGVGTLEFRARGQTVIWSSFILRWIGLFLIIGLIVPVVGLFFYYFYDCKRDNGKEGKKDECSEH